MFTELFFTFCIMGVGCQDAKLEYPTEQVSLEQCKAAGFNEIIGYLAEHHKTPHYVIKWSCERVLGV